MPAQQIQYDGIILMMDGGILMSGSSAVSAYNSSIQHLQGTNHSGKDSFHIEAIYIRIMHQSLALYHVHIYNLGQMRILLSHFQDALMFKYFLLIRFQPQGCLSHIRSRLKTCDADRGFVGMLVQAFHRVYQRYQYVHL